MLRLNLHVLALKLLIRLRRSLPEVASLKNDLAAPREENAGAAMAAATELRRATPGAICLWLIEVAVEVTDNCRRVLVRLGSAWPGLPTFRHVLQAVQHVSLCCRQCST